MIAPQDLMTERLQRRVVELARREMAPVTAENELLRGLLRRLVDAVDTLTDAGAGPLLPELATAVDDARALGLTT